VRRIALTAGALTVTLACAACGSSASATHGRSPSAAARAASGQAAHPQAVEPVAGAGASPTAVGGPGTGSVSVGASGSGGAGTSLAQPVTLSQVEQELRQSGLAPNTNQSTLTPDQLAIAPIGAPPQVQEIINAGNEIAHLPYIWGGGHARYVDNGYDCSGSISFVLAAAGLLNGTETSGQLMSYGAPGPGKWITIYATQGHTFMYVAGLRFDTVALAQSGSRWSNRSATEGGGFVARHPVGL
jgi:hypothetical protein